jgi:hypothetical protein
MTGVPTTARPAGGALGTAACRARASGRHCSAEPEGAPCSALGSRMQLTRVLCDRLRACFGCRATRHMRAKWNACCSSATRCACAVRATQRAVRADWAARSVNTTAQTVSSSTPQSSRCVRCRHLPTTRVSWSSDAAWFRHRTLQQPQRCATAPRTLCSPPNARLRLHTPTRLCPRRLRCAPLSPSRMPTCCKRALACGPEKLGALNVSTSAHAAVTADLLLQGRSAARSRGRAPGCATCRCWRASHGARQHGSRRFPCTSVRCVLARHAALPRRISNSAAVPI